MLNISKIYKPTFSSMASKFPEMLSLCFLHLIWSDLLPALLSPLLPIFSVPQVISLTSLNHCKNFSSQRPWLSLMMIATFLSDLLLLSPSGRYSLLPPQALLHMLFKQVMQPFLKSFHRLPDPTETPYLCVQRPESPCAHYLSDLIP